MPARLVSHDSHLGWCTFVEVPCETKCLKANYRAVTDALCLVICYSLGDAYQCGWNFVAPRPAFQHLLDALTKVWDTSPITSPPRLTCLIDACSRQAITMIECAGERGPTVHPITWVNTKAMSLHKNAWPRAYQADRLRPCVWKIDWMQAFSPRVTDKQGIKLSEMLCNLLRRDTRLHLLGV